MWIIELKPVAPGVYNDHRADHVTMPPEGWAMIPDDFEVPSTFPRLGSIKAKEMPYIREVEVIGEDGNPATEKLEYTMMTVISMTEGTLPEPVEDEPSEEDDLAAMVVDHEYRLTLMELGLTE